MRAPTSRLHPLARLSLLVAATCYFGVATLGPWQHLRLVAAEVAAATHTEDGSRPTAPVPVHNELSCALYHTFGSVAAPAPPVVILAASVRVREPTLDRIGEPDRTSPRSTRARAPPLSV